MTPNLYSWAVDARNFLFDKNIFKSTSVEAWTVSVGNLTMGGTGKTPVVDYLTKLFSQKNKVGIVTRGYKSKTNGLAMVDAKKPSAAGIYGDEPTMLKLRNPEVPIAVSPNRVLGAKQLVKLGCDVILADDAFQHRWLKRNLDIVVVDATENKKNYFFLPSGRARESFQALRRADLVFVTKTNWAQADHLRWLKGNIRFAKKIFEFETQSDGFWKKSEQRNHFDGESVILVSGIAKPQTFERLFPNSKIVRHFIFKDHHTYLPGEVENILSAANGLPIITTEKDAVKLNNLGDNQFWVARLKIIAKAGDDIIYENIKKPN